MSNVSNILKTVKIIKISRKHVYYSLIPVVLNDVFNDDILRYKGKGIWVFDMKGTYTFFFQEEGVKLVRTENV